MEISITLDAEGVRIIVGCLNNNDNNKNKKMKGWQIVEWVD